MIRIGEFMPRGDGFVGSLVTLGFDTEVTIVPALHSDSKNAPDYRVHAGDSTDGPEIGAGWNRSGQRAGAYIAIVIDDPQLPRAIRANLFRPSVDGGPHTLFWQRRQIRRDAE